MKEAERELQESLPGWFQADVPATLEQLAWRVDGETCHARLVQTSALDVIHRLGDVECRFPR